MIHLIVPTYNCAEYLGSCLRSLQRQTLPGTITVVDDGSTDDTAAVLAQFDGITVLRHDQNRGANSARNTGLDYVQQRHGLKVDSLVSFADADATYHPRFAEHLASALSDNLAAAAYCQWWDQKDETSRLMSLPTWDPEAVWWDTLTIPMPSMYRALCLPPQLDVTNKWRDDWKLWLWLAERGQRAIQVKQPLFSHRFRDNGKTRLHATDPWAVARDRAATRRLYCSLSRLPWPVQCLIYGQPDQTFDSSTNNGLSYSGIPMSTMECWTLGPSVASVERSDAYTLLIRSNYHLAPECAERLLWWLRLNPSIGAVGPILLDRTRQSIFAMANEYAQQLGSDAYSLGNEMLIGAADSYPDVLSMARQLSSRRQLSQMVPQAHCAMIRPKLWDLLDLSGEGVWCQPLVDAGYDCVVCHDALAVRMDMLNN